MNVSDEDRPEDRMINAASFELSPSTQLRSSNSELFSSHVRADGVKEFAVACGQDAAIYHESGVLYRSFKVEFDIRKILWTVFVPGKDDRNSDPNQEFFTVVGDQDIVFYFTDDGHRFHYYVPFKIRTVYAASSCLFVERNWRSEEEFRQQRNEHIYLYSMSHPLDELHPVIYRPNDALSQWLFCWEGGEFSVIEAVDDCLLVYDRASRVHRLLHIRRTSETDLLMANRPPPQTSSPFVGHHHSTPKPFTPTAYTPKGICEPSDGVPLSAALSVRTRSMMRLTRTRTFPIDSPALSAIGTPMSNATREHVDSPISFRLRAMSHNSTAGLHLTRVLELSPENDLMYAEFCLVCVWTEPSRKDSFAPATKAFLSRSLTDHVHLNMMVQDCHQLKSIRLVQTVDAPSTSGHLMTVSCLDATLLKGDSLTIVLEMDCSLSLFSGATKTAVIVSSLGPPSASARLLPFAGDSFVVVEKDKYSRVQLPAAYSESLVKDLFAYLLDALPHEKGSRLAADWRSRTAICSESWQKCPNSPQFHEALRFVLRQTGFEILNHPKLPIQQVDKLKEDVGAKQRRPRNSREDNLRRVLSFGATNLEDLPSYQSGAQTIEVTVDTAAPLFTSLYTVMAVVHSMWEELLLDSSNHSLRRQSVYYLHAAAVAAEMTAFSEMYALEFPDCNQLKFDLRKLGDEDLPSAHNVRNFALDSPISLFKTVGELVRERMISHQVHTHSTKSARITLVLATGVGRVNSVVDLHRLLGKNWPRKIDISSDKKSNVVSILLDRKKTNAQRCASLCRLFDVTCHAISFLPASLALLLGSIVSGDHTAIDTLFARHSSNVTKFFSAADLREISALRWPTDIRVKNAREMLDSTKPVLINTHNLIVGELDMREAQEAFLSGTCIRYLAQAMGRSMMDFRSSVFSPTAELPVPDLCLSARLFPSNLSFEIPVTDSIRPYRDWGEFYNGVSTALRIGNRQETKVDGEWLMTMCHNNDKLSQATCAGLLYGFGLNGHILNANLFHVHDLLAAVEDFQSVALLLGWSSSMMGTSDQQVYKMLTTQLPFLMGPTLLPIVIPSLIQTAAVAALGLLFTQSGHMNIVKKLLNEIGKSPPYDEVPSNDRAAYKLNAGFAVGLICLGQGNEMLESEPSFVQSQPSIVSRLLTMMNGGPRNLCVFPQQQAPAYDLVNAPPSANQQPTMTTPSSHVLESDSVNVHLTGHAACVALGLIFLRSNNGNMAKRLELPQTITLLEAVRPDLLMIRTLCRNLIMWDDIQPSRGWVIKQVPAVVMDYMRTALKWEDDDDILVLEKEDSYWDRVVDRETIAQVFIYTVTGACMSLALKFASSIDSVRKQVFDVLESFACILLPEAQQKSRINGRICEFAGTNVVSLCLNSLLTSMAMVMACSGDLSCMRVARLWRMSDSVVGWMKNSRKHQEQVSSHQAIGMLFMGNARYGFKTDNRSIAMLVMAFYPVVCHNVTDNRFYHQPLRFLWTQAVEPRLLVAMVRNSDTPVQCDIKLKLKGVSENQIGRTPFLLPHLDNIECIEIGGGSYELVRYNLTSASERQELEHVLNRNHGRVPLERNERVNLEFSSELSEDSGDIEEVFGRISDHNRCESDSDWVKRLLQVPNPLSPSSDDMSFSWHGLESIPTMSDHVRAVQLACYQRSISSAATRSVSDYELQLVCSVASWAKEYDLMYRLERFDLS